MSRRSKRRACGRRARASARARAYRRSLSLLEATIDSTADGILVVDRRGRITAYNRRFAEMWGIPEAVAAARDEGAAMAIARGALRDPEGFAARVRELYGAPDIEGYDLLELSDGRSFERYSRPQRADGHPIGRVWSFRDVTSRRRAEAERDALLTREQAARAAAERAVRARDELFASASHELKTPITSLLLSVQHLLRGGSRAGAGAPLAVVERQARRLASLIDALLDVSRIQAGRLELEREAVDLADLVHGVVADLAEPARAARVEIAVAAPSGLWGSWDRARMAQAVACLVGNAIKFGAGRPVEITCTRAGPVASIAVKDTGVGIEPGCLGRIFERFERACCASSYGGLGLGLFFARTIVEAHGGALSAASAPGEGATFTVSLPFHHAS